MGGIIQNFPDFGFVAAPVPRHSYLEDVVGFL
jgi:hypothetical protein